MPQTITLTLPDDVLQPVQRVVQATKQSLEELLVTALQAALPTLKGLPPDIMQPLVAPEPLDDQALWRVMLETVPLDQQLRLYDLLWRNQAGVLTASEHEQLAVLQQQADSVMLRKACAAVLLRFRGKRVPMPSELSRLTATDAWALPIALEAVQAFKQAHDGQEPSRLVIRTSAVIDVA
jgi:hypothetical protein